MNEQPREWDNERIITNSEALAAHYEIDDMRHEVAKLLYRIRDDLTQQLDAAKLKAATAMESAEIMKGMLAEANKRLHEMEYREDWQEDSEDDE